MIRTKLAVCAEAVIRDAQTNTVSLFNILDTGAAAGFPVLIPRLSGLFMLERDSGDSANPKGELRVLLDEEQIARLEVAIDFQGAPLTRVMVVLHGVRIPRPGTVRAQLLVDGVETAEYSFRLEAASVAA